MLCLSSLSSARLLPLPMRPLRMSSLRSLSLRALLALAALCGLSACVSSKGLAPLATIDDGHGLTAAAAVRGVVVTPAAWPAQQWWRRYDDPQLDSLVDEALAGNPTIRIAEARTRQAAAVTVSSETALMPQAGAALKNNRQHYSANSTTPKPLAGNWAWANDVGLNFSYEVDFWGKNAAALAAAVGRQKASEVEHQAARIMLEVGVAQTYLKLAQAYAQLDLADISLDQRRQIVKLTQQRVAAHLDSELDLKQAELALPLAQAQIVAARESLSLLRAQLAALLGAGPDRGERLTRPQLHATPGVAVPATLPSELLARRPDVVAQRWRVEALRSEIDAAKAQFYPSINLNAIVGMQSLGFDTLLDGSSRLLGAASALSLPVFDGGRLRANLMLRDADYDVAVEQYNQTLVEAMHDVVSQLLSLQWLQQRRSLQQQALSTARQAQQLALKRYRSGLGNYLQVLSTDIAVLEQQRTQIDLDTRAYDLDIALVRALGGGYQLPPPSLPSSPSATALPGGQP